MEGEKREREMAEQEKKLRGAESDGLVAPQELTELETVDAQAGISGVVQPSLLSPAAGRVCVHLPGCHPCTTTVVLMQQDCFSYKAH